MIILVNNSKIFIYLKYHLYLQHRLRRRDGVQRDGRGEDADPTDPRYRELR